jgi:hypothetical protein
VLPRRLEEFELASHARRLLEIPRVVALEPPSHTRPRWLPGEMVSAMQARRLRFPGEPCAFVLYGPAQYPLARALIGAHGKAELWYVPPESAFLTAGGEEEIALDELARARAREVLVATRDGDPETETEPLRARLHELGVISHRPFLAALGTAPHRRRGKGWPAPSQ